MNSSSQIAFVFGGQGPEWWAMGRELYGSEPTFAARVRESDDALRRVSRWSILDQFSVTEVKSHIRRVDIAQAMLLAVHLGLAALWEEWGIVPAAVVGHAAGELSAACYAGALTIDDAMRVIVARAAVMRRLAGSGLMMAVKADAATGAQLIRGLEDHVAVAVVNGPQSIVLSGDGDAMVGVAHQLASRRIQHRVLHLPYAVHAPRMAAAAPELGRTLSDIAPTTTRIPLVSTVTGGVIDGAELDAAHWARNIAEPVRFADALTTLFDLRVRKFVEIGPHATLGRAIAECATAAGQAVIMVPSLHRGKPERATMRKSLEALNETIGGTAEKQPKVASAPGASAARSAPRETSPARIVPMQPPSRFPAMYFIGPVGGDPLSLRDIAAALGPSYRSFALVPPGLSDGETPIVDVARIAESLADQLAAQASTQPIALVGHSVGGTLAFETARLLERRGAKVEELVLIDAPLNTAASAASANARGLLDATSIAALAAYRPDAGGEFHGRTTFITPARPQDGFVDCAARWRELCPMLQVTTTAGTHLTMVRAPHAAKIARSIHELFDAGDVSPS